MASGSVFLVEDHDEALGIWKTQGVKNLDLIHLDAHLDFGVYAAHPIQEVILKARSLKELKDGLEKSIAYRFFQNDFSKQLHIGNYIYPAMREGIVRNFYWVIPGTSRNLRESYGLLKRLLKDTFKSPATLESLEFHKRNACVKAGLLGRNFIICTLDTIPVLTQEVLLDIDTDFLTTKNLSQANTASLIGKRMPWIQPLELTSLLNTRIKNQKVVTIAYSVNGGYTPIVYRQLADEIAYCFAPREFKKQFTRSKKAAANFCNFLKTGERRYYWKAVALNRHYRSADNNYGPLYLSAGRFARAGKEFRKVQKADPRNPACLNGLGLLAFKKRDFYGAKKLFLAALRCSHGKPFENLKKQVLFNLGQAWFGLKDYRNATKSLFRSIELDPMHAEAHYLLGLIFEKTGDFKLSAKYLHDSLRLGPPRIATLEKLLKIAWQLNEKNDIIGFVRLRLKEIEGLSKMRKSRGSWRDRLLKEEGYRVRRLKKRLLKAKKEVRYV